MTPYRILALARDWSILFLALEGLVILTLIAFLTYKTVGALGRFLPQMQSFLCRARGWGERSSRAVMRATATVRKPFIWLESTSQGLKAARGAWNAPNIKRR